MIYFVDEADGKPDESSKKSSTPKDNAGQQKVGKESRLQVVARALPVPGRLKQYILSSRVFYQSAL